jgi:replicative superfamily II helicase
LAAGTKSQIYAEDNDDWRFVSITPAPKKPIERNSLISVTELPRWCHQAFGSATHLNQIQSIVYHVAFKQSRSMLIAAPTGAGKTNIALMTILREISQHIGDDHESKQSWSVRDKQFKIIYIAPLKALASEIVDKFQKALSYLGV